MDEPRAILKKADTLLAGGHFREAIAAYTTVALHYEGQGFALKSIAIWKQVRAIAAREPSLGAEAKAHMITLYRSLGLERDAVALEGEDTR